MKRLPRGLFLTCALAALLAAGGSVAAQTAADPALLRDLANQDRAHANDARQRAKQWEDMAAKARARAAASSGSVQQSWQQSAQDDQNSADELKNEANAWDEKARDLDTQAQEASGGPPTNAITAPPGGSEPTPATSSNQPANSPAPQSATTPATAGGAAPNPPSSASTTTANFPPLGGSEPGVPSPPSSSGWGGSGFPPLGGSEPGQPAPAAGPTPAAVTGASGCSSQADQAPIDKDDVDGEWTDDANGERVQLQTVGATVRLTGRHKWYGEWENGALKLDFTRYPEPNEMGAAPDWARTDVYQKVKWELELEAHRDCGQLELRGKWYPGEFKWRAQSASGKYGVQDSISEIGRGTPIDIKYVKPPAAIARVIVLENQPEVAHGIATFGYPFQKNPVLFNTERTLFICGRGLPKNWRKPIAFESDPNFHLKYFAVAIYKDPASSGHDDQFKQGFQIATEDVDPAYAPEVQKLDAMIVKVQLQQQVLPGIKDFKLNGLEGAWTLQFGDQRAALRFARRIAFQMVDTMDDVFLPERVFLQLKTDIPFPLDQVALRVWVNGKEVDWAGQPTIVAYRDANDPTLYRTQDIELVEGAPPSKQEPGIFYLPVKVGDHIYARLEDPNLLSVTDDIARALVHRTPAEFGMTWKEALTKAAQADGFEVSDWSQLTAQKATDISNYALTEIVSKGPIRHSVPVTVGEQAAMLMMREELVRQLNFQKEEFSKQIGNLGLRGFREVIKLAGWNGQFPWRYLRVQGPGNPLALLVRNIDLYAPDTIVNLADADLPSVALPYAISDDYLKEKFGDDHEAADKWSLQAVQQGLDQYQRAIDFTLTKIHEPSASDALINEGRSLLPSGTQWLVTERGLPSRDVEGLLKLLGLWYGPLLDRTLPRLMQLSSDEDTGRNLWTPALAGRFITRNLDVVAQAVQAQQDYSKLDTQEAMLFASMVLTPFAMGEGVVATSVAFGGDSAFLGYTLNAEVPEYLQQRDDFKVALGSSIVLGTNRLTEEELKRTEWFSVLPNLIMNVVGVGASGMRLMLVIAQKVAEMRAAMILNIVERDGAAGLKKLPLDDQVAFFRYATESKLIEQSGDTKLLTEARARASKALDKVAEDLGVVPPTEEARVRIEAVGEAVRPAEEKPPNADYEEARQGTTYARCDSPCTEILTNVEFDPVQPRSVPAKMPVENRPWVTIRDGSPTALSIGKFIGEGNYATVYELKFDKYPMIPGCEEGCVIKVYQKEYAYNAPTATGKQAVDGTNAGAQYLGKEIPQLEIIAAEPDAPVPYVIQKKLRPGMKTFEPRVPDIDPQTKLPKIDPDTGEPVMKLNTEAVARFNADEGLQRAVVELYYKIASKGLVWEDGHLGNMYFFKDTNGQWVAGVLDQDRIIPFSARKGRMGAWISAAELYFMPNKCRSMYKTPRRFRKFDFAWLFAQKNPVAQFPDATYFMEKMFEYKSWVLFDPSSDEFQQLFLKPEIIREKFPQMFDRTNPRAAHPARLDRLELKNTQGFSRSSRRAPLDLVPGRASKLAAASDGIRSSLIQSSVRMAA